MKNAIMITISLSLFFSLAGCEEKKEPTADNIVKAFEKREEENKKNRVQGGDPKGLSLDITYDDIRQKKK